MRITNSMLVNRFIGNLNTNLTRLSDLQTKLANNRKYAHISDDPISVIYAQQARYKLARMEDYRSNVMLAREWTTTTESALMDIQNIMQDAMEYCNDASNDTKTDVDRTLIANNIQQLRDQLLSTLNAVFGDKYVFGGYNTVGYPDGGRATPPFGVDNAGNLTLNNQVISKRVFSGTSIGDNLTVGGGTTVNVTDNEKLRIALGSADRLGMTFSDDGSGGLVFTVAGQNVIFNTPTDLETAGGFLKFDKAGIEVTLSQDVIDDLKAKLPNWGTGQSLSPNPDGSGDIVYEFPKDFENLSTNNFLVFTNTLDPNSLYISQDMYDRLASDKLAFDVGPGIEMQVAMNGLSAVIYDGNGNNVYQVLDDLYNAMSGEIEMTSEDLSMFIGKLQTAQEHALALCAEIGGRQNRLDMLESRYDQDELNYITMLSNAEDADQAELIMWEKMAESVYKAALQTGAYIIQPTLMDFLR